MEVEAYLRRRYESQIADIDIVEKEDLDLVRCSILLMSCIIISDIASILFVDNAHKSIIHNSVPTINLTFLVQSILHFLLLNKKSGRNGFIVNGVRYKFDTSMIN